jgi:hypothetical protein
MSAAGSGGSALAAYDGCLQVMNRFPGDWGFYAFDLLWARTLVEQGLGSPDELRSYLQIVRGLGDPLINPAHEEATVRAGLTSLTALDSHTTSAWLPPFVRYGRGVSLAQLERPYAALAMLRQAREGGDVPLGSGRARSSRRPPSERRSGSIVLPWTC